MKAAFAIAVKDLRILRRDRFAVFWTLGFPLVYAIFFGFIASGGGGPRGKIKLAIVDQDGGKATKEFVARLSQS
ncbi:MAG TPA: ABC transporter permease, partial [Planctomycetia bacterium]|nr:ABC transporter permease [Planctomycetia bacterium]